MDPGRCHLRGEEKWVLTAFGEVRLGNDVSQFDEELLSAGVTYSALRWMSLSTGYLYVHADPDLSGLNHENRVYVDATFKAPPFHGFLLADRIRPELRWLQLPTGVSSPRDTGTA